MTLRAELEAAMIRVYFADRKDRIATELVDAVIDILSRADPKQIRDMIHE